MARLIVMLVFLLQLVSVADAKHQGKIIGAIRWDAYYIEADVAERPFVEAALGDYQGRAPLCAKSVTSTAVDLDSCATQAAIDREIMAAHNAGLDFWMYDWAGPNDVMMNAWRLHQSSRIKNKMNWAISLGYPSLVQYAKKELPLYIRLMKQNNYQKTFSGAPLLFLTNDTASAHPTSTALLAAAIKRLRGEALQNNLPSPYIVLLTGYSTPSNILDLTGADAVSFYAIALQRGSYSELVAYVQKRWAQEVATEQQVVPTAETGWDRRPIIAHPVPWEPSQKPMAGYDRFINPGTPAQIATHVASMMAFIDSHPRLCPQGVGLIYSWNEHIEGGSTLNPTLSGGAKILNAVSGVLSF